MYGNSTDELTSLVHKMNQMTLFSCLVEVPHSTKEMTDDQYIRYLTYLMSGKLPPPTKYANPQIH